MSVLERMYTYAKAVGAGARENFTTEALAGAIRTDPSPFIEFLQTSGVLPRGGIGELEVETQLVLPGTGVLDMVLVAYVGGNRHEIWIEVKVLAGESGTQLDAYVRHLGRVDPDVRPRLAILARHPLRSLDGVPFLSWHGLRRLAETSSIRAWRDFAEYLAEIRMSDDFDQPFDAEEAASLDRFRRLHGKVARIIVDAGTEALLRWPMFPWATKESGVRSKIFERLATHQQLLVGVPPPNSKRGIWMTYGADLSGDQAVMHVAVETWPSAYDLQRKVLELADRAAFSADWQRAFGAWGGVKRVEPLIALGEPDRAKVWLLDRFEELAEAGILPLVAGNPAAA